MSSEHTIFAGCVAKSGRWGSRQQRRGRPVQEWDKGLFVGGDMCQYIWQWRVPSLPPPSGRTL